MLRFVLKGVGDFLSITAADLDALRVTGWSDRDIWTACTTAPTW